MQNEIIEIEKLNDVYIKVTSSRSIEQELADRFTFLVEGYKFMPAYKSGIFDGKIRLYNLAKKTIYAGLLHHILKYAEENDLTVNYLNEVATTEDIDIDYVKKFTDWLNIHSRGKPIELRDYQIDGIHRALTQKRLLLLSPTSSGKSALIYSLIRHHLEHNRRCLIIVPSISLVSQMYGDFVDYSSDNGWKTENYCQQLQGGMTKDISKPVLTSTWQSIFKQPKAWFDQFDVVICDEVHTAVAKSLSGIMEKLTATPYRIGLTGTLSASKTNKLVLEGHFGPVNQVISTNELMTKNQIAQLKIKCLLLKYDEDTKKTVSKYSYQDEIDYLVTNPARNKFIRNLTLSTTGNTLVLFTLVEKHGKKLYDMIAAKAGDRKVFLVYGDVSAERREEIRALVAKEKDAIIIASYATYQQGINVPSIENIVFASPTKSKIRSLQSIGRGLRLNDGKTHCTLFDIADDLSWKKSKNHTLKHLTERLKIYSEEKFNFKIIEVPIE